MGARCQRTNPLDCGGGTKLSGTFFCKDRLVDRMIALLHPLALGENQPTAQTGSTRLVAARLGLAQHRGAVCILGESGIDEG